MPRDNFPKAVRDHLARSVNYHCSICSAPTAGPFARGGKSVTTGEAAHICAAAPGGPRYDAMMTPEQRRSYENGIWVCAAHSSYVDVNWPLYTREQLHELKRLAEAKADDNLRLAKAQADLRAVLAGPIQWIAPTESDERGGYSGFHHVVFTLGGARRQRGRVYLEVGGDDSRFGVISRQDDRFGHEWPDLRPHEPCRVPVFTKVDHRTAFWLDGQVGVSTTPLQPGTYITDQPFLNGLHRAPLPPGSYTIRVKLVLGDSEHAQPFYSEVKTVDVQP